MACICHSTDPLDWQSFELRPRVIQPSIAHHQFRLELKHFLADLAITLDTALLIRISRWHFKT